MPELSLPKLEESYTCGKRTSIEHMQDSETECQAPSLSNRPPSRISGILLYVAHSYSIGPSILLFILHLQFYSSSSIESYIRSRPVPRSFAPFANDCVLEPCLISEPLNWTSFDVHRMVLRVYSHQSRFPISLREETSTFPFPSDGKTGDIMRLSPVSSHLEGLAAS
jgi:hypothetical protein